MEEETYGESEEFAELLPRNYGRFGLKVASKDEAATVQRVSYATMALAGLSVLHVVIHIMFYGHIEHAIVQLFFALLMPAFGFDAVRKRSTSRVYVFHLLNILYAFTHFMALFIVIDLLGKDPGVACSSSIVPAHECPVAYSDTFRGSFSTDQKFWRCHHGACIAGAGRCNLEVNCYDGSDEDDCPTGPALEPSVGPASNTETDRQKIIRMSCEERMKKRKEYMPKLKWWWLIMSLPLWALNTYAAYHCLEFYVQLRVRAFSATVNQGTIVVGELDNRNSDGLE